MNFADYVQQSMPAFLHAAWWHWYAGETLWDWLAARDISPWGFLPLAFLVGAIGVGLIGVLLNWGWGNPAGLK